MYKAWKVDPSSVHKSWDVYFRGVESGNEAGAFVAPPTIAGGKFSASTAGSTSSGGSGGAVSEKAIQEHVSLYGLIRAYQVRGHNIANLDPLNIADADLTNEIPSELIYTSYGFTEADLDREFSMFSTDMTPFKGLGDEKTFTLRQLITRLEGIYTKNIGYEYMHIMDRQKCAWLRDQIETPGEMSLTKEEKILTMERLNQADGFERFLQAKWGTEKRFSLEGIESTVPGMKTIIDTGSALGLEGIVFGMSHRGRLNVLGNVMKKKLESIFSEFNHDLTPSEEGSGDVKYHLGASHDRMTRAGKNIHLSLVANPSHLEAVSPVVIGKVCANQFYDNDANGTKTMPVLLHGDAAFSGQGIVWETLNLGDLPAYNVGGTIHIVTNNQVGFTTDPRFSRSSPYCTDVAKSMQCPVVHVNADDVEAVVKVCELAVRWRQKYHSDFIIDIIGYRRYGHNEGDNPSFTQPKMYQAIAKHPRSNEIYKNQLIKEGVLTENTYQEIEDSYQNLCKESFELSKTTDFVIDEWLESKWEGFKNAEKIANINNTGVSRDILKQIGNTISQYPSDFNVHNGVKRILKARQQTVDNEDGLIWGTAEALAFGSLCMEGYHVRLSGQDVERGTFGQRHHVLHDQKVDGKTYNALQSLSPSQAEYTACNSALSEYGVLGFELGYSMANPNSLVVWEAQFGDFMNGAQIIFDQFLSSGEQKWLRQSGLTILLPHGYEGQGPEHSSSRVERFLQMCDDDESTYPDLNQNVRKQIQLANWQVLNCSTPANYFHALRRQVHREFRKPLILITPKNLLRLKEATSSIDEIAEGTRFRRLIPEEGISESEASNVNRVIFCTGKIKYELWNARKQAGLENQVAIASIEQISPFPFDLVQRQMEGYPNADVMWVQEEPKNMGCWSYVSPRIETALKNVNGMRPSYAGRAASAATATGLKAQHKKETKQLLAEALSVITK